MRPIKCIYPGCKKPAKPGARYCYGHLAVVFFEKCCCHVTGEWQGQPFRLMPWQKKVLMDVYGNVDANGYRKTRFVWVEIPKKNGKSEFASGIALMGLCGPDNEGSPEVYCCAGDIQQARRVFDPARFMAENNAHLREKIKPIHSQKRIVNYSNNGVLQVLSSEVFTKHGLNPSVVVFDEIHAQPNDQLWRVMTEETDVARKQQLVVVLTTAGEADQDQIGYKLHKQVKQIHDGVVKNPNWYVVMYGADEKTDDPGDPKVWKRTNPAIGHIFDMARLKKNYEEVKQRPDKMVDWQRFRLNMWVGQVNRYIMPVDWESCSENYELDDLFGRRCYAGLDLSTKVDLTAFVLLFPPIGDDDKFLIWPYFYLPEDMLLQRQRKDTVPFVLWKKRGFLNATPGNAIDYNFIKHDIINAAKLFDLRTVAFDPWNAGDIATNLNEVYGVPMVEFRQGYKSMSEPTKELQKMIITGEIGHNKNPVMDWCIDNLAVDIDHTAENVKPTKKKSKERIDGAVALIDAIGAWLLDKGNTSRYDGDPTAEVIVL